MLFYIINKKRTAHNRIVNASPPYGGSGSVRLGRSLRSLPRLAPPQFASPGLAPQALIRAVKPSFTTGNVKRHVGKKIKKLLNKIFISFNTAEYYFTKVITEYPESEWTDDAKVKIKLLKKLYKSYENINIEENNKIIDNNKFIQEMGLKIL